LVLFIAKVVQDFLTPYRIADQLSQKDNVALGVSISGYYLGVIIVFLGAVYQPLTVVRDDGIGFTSSFGLEVVEVGLYALVGILILNLARILVDRLVLYKFDVQNEIVENQNIGAGAVELGVYISVGLVIAASIAGSSGGSDASAVIDSVVRSAAFLILGMIVLILFTIFYEFTTSFSIHEQISQQNVSVGVALSGNLIAIGVIVFKAVFGEFVGWSESIIGFLVFAIIGFILLYVVRVVVDLVLLPGTKVSDELSKDRNLGVGFIEGSVVISVAMILNFAI
jgi:uncharacterized membrane protein YjfL (UPF0719 family)